MSTDWIPLSVVTVGQCHLLRWVQPGSGPLFREPFFKQSVEALLAANAAQKLTPLAALADVAPIKGPRGFIFHVSRCGSTLISRSLAALPRHRVISEPPPLNQLLLAEDIDSPLKALLLRGMIHALCGSADGVDCFFKLTSWNVLFLEEIRALFPDTPWLFVYREPIDVVLSSIQGPPRWIDNEPLARRMGNPHMGGVEHILFNLERMYEAPLGKLDGLGRLVEYAQLPAAMADIVEHFGLCLSEDERAQIARVGRFDAKTVGEVAFRPRVRTPISDALDVAMAPLEGFYARLESLRAEPTVLSPAPLQDSDKVWNGRESHWLARRDQRLVALREAGRVLSPSR